MVREGDDNWSVFVALFSHSSMITHYIISSFKKPTQLTMIWLSKQKGQVTLEVMLGV